MIGNYVQLAFRHFRKDKKFAIVSLIGLVAGLTAVILIFAYVKFELSYDKVYSNAPDIYRCILVNRDGSDTKSIMVPSSLSKTLAAEYPEISDFTSLFATDITVYDNKRNAVRLPAIYGYSSFFNVFNLPFVSGNPLSALSLPGSAVLSVSAAKKLFRSENPLGKILMMPGNVPLKITGVMKDLPVNIHFSGDVIVSSPVTDEPLSLSAFSADPQYIKLQKGTLISTLERKLSPFYKKYGFEKQTLEFQPVQSIHLHSNLPYEPFLNSDIRTVYIFQLIGLLILTIASFNYINLTTARSIARSKEVGVRKVLGATKMQLRVQFLTESMLLFFIAFPLALLAAYLIKPAFADLLQIPVETVTLTDWNSISFLMLITLITAFISGTYPAFFLSNMQTTKILKGRNAAVNLGVRKVLIVLQFAISAALVVGTVIISDQLKYIGEVNLGFNKKHLLVLPFSRLDQKATAFKQELLSNNGIEGVSIAGLNIGKQYNASSSMSSPEDETKAWNFSFIDADFDFIKTMQIPLIAGRSFSRDFAADRLTPDKILDSLKGKRAEVSQEERNAIRYSQSIIITKRTAELINLDSPYIGKVIHLGALQGTVIGLIDDFKGLSLKQKNPALVLRANEKSRGNVFVRIDAKHVAQSIAFIERVWKSYLPDNPFEYSFVDDRIDQQYKSDQRLGSFFKIFAVLAIGIASMGLYSLLALTIEQRKKEIGIRKVLGADVMTIVRLLSYNFVKLIIVGILVSFPIAGWIMNGWLRDFESRTEIQWWVFLIAGLLTLIVSIITVILQSAKAAFEKPVDVLKIE